MNGCTIFKLGGNVIPIKYDIPKTLTVRRSKSKVTRATYFIPGKCTRVVNRQLHELQWVVSMLTWPNND